MPCLTNDHMMECKQDEIVMQWAWDPSALEALINFAYNGHLAIDQQNVQSLADGGPASCSCRTSRTPVALSSERVHELVAIQGQFKSLWPFRV
uniref:Uncharacterized protein n=1 Tax=Sphaerodactylus townsendi TaxID=933632 RepID=A0ACB8FXB6_9SAUR